VSETIEGEELQEKADGNALRARRSGLLTWVLKVRPRAARLQVTESTVPPVPFDPSKLRESGFLSQVAFGTVEAENATAT